MYRIRRLTGGEVNLASLDELAAAIAAGAVTADAEIYHQRADRWLPIANHPHFRIAKDRSQSPARKPTPVPSPAAGAPTQPALRLVRSDMSGTTSSEARPVSRWTPPLRAMGTAPRPSGSAAPSIEPTAGHVVEFVAETPDVAPTPAPVEQPRPKRVEQATVGLPLLEIDMPEPPRALRQPTPMPSPARPRMPLALPEPGPVPIGARQPTPMPSPATWPSMQSAPREAPKLERTPAPAPIRQPTPAPVRVPTPAPVAVAAPMPWDPPAVEPSLDLPPAVTDFGAAADASTSETEPVGSAAEPGVRASSRWPMVVGAMVLIAAAAFFALRPRPEVDSLDPRPVATVPAPQPTPPTGGAPMSAAADTRPQITPVVPPGPSPEAAEERLQPIESNVVPAAPKLTGALPESALTNVGAIEVPLDPTAAQRHRALEETRRQIESQMQR